MVDPGGPVEAELREYELEHLEVIVLLVAHHIDVGIEMVLRKAALGSAQVLGDVHRSAVGTLHYLPVQAVPGEVAPYGTVRVLDEDSHFQALLHEFLAEEVGIVLVIDLVEAYAQGLVGLVEAIEYPGVHHRPEGAHLRISRFPIDEHLVHVLENGRVLLLHPGVLDIAVAHQMVALLARAFRSGAVEALLPGIHALAYMHSPVVHERGLDYLVSGCLQYVGNAGSEEVVAYVSKVQGLVGVRGGELHHHRPARRLQRPEIRVGSYPGEGFVPVEIGKAEVQEALHAIVG